MQITPNGSAICVWKASQPDTDGFDPTSRPIEKDRKPPAIAFGRHRASRTYVRNKVHKCKGRRLFILHVGAPRAHSRWSRLCVRRDSFLVFLIQLAHPLVDEVTRTHWSGVLVGLVRRGF